MGSHKVLLLLAAWAVVAAVVALVLCAVLGKRPPVPTRCNESEARHVA